MARIPFQKTWRGQLLQHSAFPTHDDGENWQVVCPFFPMTTSDYYRPWLVPKATRDIAPSVAMPAPYTSLTITELHCWVSLGYLLQPEILVFDVLGTCVDAHEEMRPMFRITVDGVAPHDSYQEIAPNSGLAVHATPNPIALQQAWQAITGQKEFPRQSGVPVTTAFYQKYTQLAPMTYHRNNTRNIIVPEAPIVVPAGKPAQIEARFSSTLAPGFNLLEMDGYVKGYLEEV